MILDLFAGPGGWDLALRWLGQEAVGIEIDRDACATRAAAGLATIRADVSALPPRGSVEGLIASPPCKAFSRAGNREGIVHAPALARAIQAEEWGARPDPDPLVWLALEVGRWASELRPRWIACEQVPEVLPLWHAYAGVLRGRGYSVWAGVLSAERFGVPQTRDRAILMASLDGAVSPPEPTHQEYQPGVPAREERGLLGTLLPWVSMAEALGWNGAVSALNTGRDWKPGGSREDAQTIPTESPAPALTAKSGGQWQWAGRPATTVCGDARLWPPGHKINSDDERRLGADEAAERYGDRAGTEAIRLEVEEGLVLQSFPPDYPVQGTRTSQWTQIGNAIPPLLARAILAELLA